MAHCDFSKGSSMDAQGSRELRSGVVDGLRVITRATQPPTASTLSQSTGETTPCCRALLHYLYQTNPSAWPARSTVNVHASTIYHLSHVTARSPCLLPPPLRSVSSTTDAAQCVSSRTNAMVQTHELQHDSLGSILCGSVGDYTQDVVSYNGIQYATVNHRWTRSNARELYPAKYEAMDFGPKCSQPEHLNNTGDYGPDIPFPKVKVDEFECLNLNVTTHRTCQTPYPVMVWIHGGSLLNGANSDSIWDANNLVQWSIKAGRPIVVVSINYRLGPFGYFQPPAHLAENDDMAQGNFGFHDQLLALMWVRRHIGGFGGDPERVTLAGESAGGTSVHAHIAYQASRSSSESQLFHRAIMQSGNLGVMGVWSPERLGELWTEACKDAGLPASTREGVNGLRRMDPFALGQLPTLNMSGYGVFSDGCFVSEPLLSPEGEFRPYELRFPVMHGDNADEGNIFREASSQASTLKTLERIGTIILGESGLASLLSVYGLSDWRSLPDEERARRFNAFPEDARFYLPTDALQAAWPQSMQYHFTAKSPFASSAFPGDSFHTLELLHLFGNFDDFLGQERNQAHLDLGQRIRSLWVNFIYGELPWEGAGKGVAATFGADGTQLGPVGDCRQWSNERKERIERLHALGYARIVQLATRVFP